MALYVNMAFNWNWMLEFKITLRFRWIHGQWKWHKYRINFCNNKSKFRKLIWNQRCYVCVMLQIEKNSIFTEILLSKWLKYYFAILQDTSIDRKFCFLNFSFLCSIALDQWFPFEWSVSFWAFIMLYYDFLCSFMFWKVSLILH